MARPQESQPWTDKDRRKYEHIKEATIESGKKEDDAQEIAARVVNKDRREEGRTPNVRTQGTGNPNKLLEERSRDELYNLAKERNVRGRSLMDKKELMAALRKAS